MGRKKKEKAVVDDCPTVDDLPIKKRVGRKRVTVAGDESQEKTTPPVVDDVKKPRSRKPKVAADVKSDVKDSKKGVKRASKKKSKKRKKQVDTISKSDNITPVKKEKQTIIEIDEFDYDYVEGETKKRKRRSPKKKPEYETDYTFTGSFYTAGSDARVHFLTVPDESHEGYRWCPRFEYRMVHKLCGLYVTPKCKNKFKCDNFDYGMEIKCRYQLTTVEREEKKTKKKKEDAFADIVENEEMNDYLNDTQDGD